MKILYGTINYNIDVTNICNKYLKYKNYIMIPNSDINRANLFTDPLIGISKQIIIIFENNNSIYQLDENYLIKIDLSSYNIIAIHNNDVDNKLFSIHNKLHLNYGYLYEELPEQKMVTRYLNGDEKVLELGGNIGRNSLVISSILNDDKNLVTLESNDEIVKQLDENKKLNNLNFYIENSALSKRKLIQKGWDTFDPNEYIVDGCKEINCITLDNLISKYNINFDTLVIDCEGAFYYILLDMPEILNNINLIIMENDYHHIDKKLYVDNILSNNKFIRHYSESGGWGDCYNCFYEVWIKYN